MNQPINHLRKCIYCGYTAYTTEQLEDFVSNKTGLHGKMNRCKYCHNLLRPHFARPKIVVNVNSQHAWGIFKPEQTEAWLK